MGRGRSSDYRVRFSLTISPAGEKTAPANDTHARMGKRNFSAGSGKTSDTAKNNARFFENLLIFPVLCDIVLRVSHENFGIAP